MLIPLISDLKNDRFLKRNLIRVGGFLGLIILLDYLLAFLLLVGIERNYGLKSDSAILLVGHSHLMLAIDKVELEKLTGKRVAKYTREGVNIADREVMLRQYFSVCKKKPGLVVLSIDPWLFTGEGLSKNSYKLFYPFLDTPEVDSYVRNAVPEGTDYFLHKYFRSSRFDIQLINSCLRGYLGNWTNLKFGTIDTVKLNREIESGNYRRIKFEQENISMLVKILEFLKDQNVRVILLNTPIYRSLISVQNPQNQKSLSIISQIASGYPNAQMLDLSPEFTNRDEYFFDPIHMNPIGQKAVTELFYTRLQGLSTGQ